MTLSAQEFRERAAKKRKTTTAEIPDVGSVLLRAVSAGDAVKFQAEIKAHKALGKDPEELAFSLIARSWIDENGELWMPEEEGIELAKSLDPDVYNALATAVLKLNGLSADAVEEAGKNFEASRTGSAPTGSQENSGTPT